jgi:hypothetical protein
MAPRSEPTPMISFGSRVPESLADPEGTADVGERDGRHLVVEFGRHSDEDTAEAKQGSANSFQ